MGHIGREKQDSGNTVSGTQKGTALNAMGRRSPLIPPSRAAFHQLKNMAPISLPVPLTQSVQLPPKLASVTKKEEGMMFQLWPDLSWGSQG